MSDQIYELAAWTLIHFVWQGAMMAALVWLLLQFVRGNARVRYVILCGGLASLSLCPLLTIAVLSQSSTVTAGEVAVMHIREAANTVEPIEFGTVLQSSSIEQDLKIEESGVQAEVLIASPSDFASSESVPGYLVSQSTQWIHQSSAWLTLAWVLGVFILSLRLLFGWLRTQKIKSNSIALHDQTFHKMMVKLQQRFGIARVVRLCQSTEIDTPAVIGWLKPAILLPASALTGLSTEQLHAILAHELAHIRRHDYLVNLLQSLVEILLFYHPAVWWISSEIRKERENCCDDLAISVCSSRRSYIEALLQLEQQRGSRNSLALAATDGSLMQRVSRMLGRSASHRRYPSSIGSLIAISIAALVLACALPEQETSGTETSGTETIEVEEVQETAQEAVEMVDFKFNVVDANGEPIADAKLYFSASQDTPLVLKKHNLTTDADGEVSQELLATTTRIRVWCRAKGYAPMFANWEPEYFNSGNSVPEQFTFALFAGESIGGRLVDSDGDPVEGAKIQVSYRSGGIPPLGKRQKYDNWLAYGDAAVTTDADGVWVLENIPPGDGVQVALTINHPDYVSDENPGELQKQQSIRMKDLADHSAEIVMKKGALAHGMITSAKTAEPVTDAVVVWGDDPYNQRGSQETRVDKEGRFQLPSMKPGKMRVTVLAPGFAPESKLIDMQAEMEPIGFSLKRGRKLQIQFVDPEDNPVPNVYVSVQKWRGSEAMYNHRHPNVLDTKIPRVSDANGLYVWEWAPEDPVTFSFGAKGYAHQREVELTATEKPQQFVMYPSLYVSGTVSDEEGKDLDSFSVIPMTVLRSSAHERRDRAVKGVDGFFEITSDRSDAGLQLKIEADGYGTHLTDVFRVGQPFEPLDIVLKKVEPVEYEVVDVDGKPAANADFFIAPVTERLTIDVTGVDRSAFGRKEMITDENGKIKLEPATDPRTLIAMSEHGYAEVADHPDQPATKKIRLKKWFRIQGDVSVNGEFDGARPVATPVRFVNGKSMHIQQTYWDRSRDGGQFLIEKMPRMPIRVYFNRSSESDPSQRRYSIALEPKSDTVDLQFPNKVTGQVVLAGDRLEKVDWLKSKVVLKSGKPSIGLPPELKELIRKKRLNADDPEEVSQYFQKTYNQEAMRPYLMCFDEYSIQLNSEGKFDFQVMRPGKYELTVVLNEDYKKRPFLPLGELTRTVEVTNSGVDLGKLRASTFASPQVGSAVENLTYTNRKIGLPASFKVHQGRFLLLDFWKPWDDQSNTDAESLEELAGALDHERLSVLSLHTYNRTDGERKPKKLPRGLSWVEGRGEYDKLRAFRKTINALTPQHYVMLDEEGKYVMGGNLDELKKALRRLELFK